MAGRFATCIGLVLLATSIPAVAQDGPQPPCLVAPSPSYAHSGNAPAVQVWAAKDLAGGWAPPACTGWQPLPFHMLVATAGRFRHQGDARELLGRFASVSAFASIRYWSVSDHRWQPLLTEAFALERADVSARRRDFSPDELKIGADAYFIQNDNRSSGDVIYRMRVREMAQDKMILEMENVGVVRFLFMSLADPGALQTLFFLERHTPDEWNYYSLARISASTSVLMTGHEASYINRAVAFFRYAASLPTDRDPPAAP